MRESFENILKLLKQKMQADGCLVLDRSQSEFLINHLKNVQEGYLTCYEELMVINQMVDGDAQTALPQNH